MMMMMIKYHKIDIELNSIELKILSNTVLDKIFLLSPTLLYKIPQSPSSISLYPGNYADSILDKFYLCLDEGQVQRIPQDPRLSCPYPSQGY